VSATAAQCTAWETFRGSISSTTTYSSITIKGTFDATGVTCSGAGANTLCQNLRTGTTTSIACSGRTWAIGGCGSSTIGASPAISLAAEAGVCSCTSPSYVARPCIDFGITNPNWGGANTATCSGPTQTLTVVCQ